LIVAVPAVVAVKVLVQVAVAVVPERVHTVNEPVTPLTVKVTEPVGVVAPVVEVSVTVAVQVDPWPTTTGLVQDTDVVVV
jgi:hypothetical protein